jgi:hypothetical protein
MVANKGGGQRVMVIKRSAGTKRERWAALEVATMR